jgi:hypothetical protein
MPWSEDVAHSLVLFLAEHKAARPEPFKLTPGMPYVVWSCEEGASEKKLRGKSDHACSFAPLGMEQLADILISQLNGQKPLCHLS